ncbi:unnamed protein product, partial [Nesidiocoris tenuis]
MTMNTSRPPDIDPNPRQVLKKFRKSMFTHLTFPALRSTRDRKSRQSRSLQGKQSNRVRRPMAGNYLFRR